MFESTPMRREHLIELTDQPMNAWVKNAFNVDKVDELIAQGAMSFIVDGKVMVCGGIANYWPGRGEAWTLFSEQSKYCFVSTLRAIKRYLNAELNTRFNRIELSVPVDFMVGHRRALILGFKVEIPRAKKYFQDCQDAVIYSMVRE